MLLKLKKNKKGFTLIELIVVVAIIAILAAIAVPQFIGMQTKAQRGVDVANATSLANAINVYNAGATTAITAVNGATGNTAEALLGTMWPTGLTKPAPAHVAGRITFPTAGVASVTVTTTDADPS